MEGRLYTAQEIFDALQTATANLYDDDDVMMSLFVARVGTNIACGVMQILKFDEQKTIEYCKKKIEKEEGKEKAHKEEEMSDTEFEYEPYELMFRCPHCNKVSKAKIMVRTDDENTMAAFELLSNFEIKGKKEEE